MWWGGAPHELGMGWSRGTRIEESVFIIDHHIRAHLHASSRRASLSCDPSIGSGAAVVRLFPCANTALRSRGGFIGTYHTWKLAGGPNIVV